MNSYGKLQLRSYFLFLQFSQSMEKLSVRNANKDYNSVVTDFLFIYLMALRNCILCVLPNARAILNDDLEKMRDEKVVAERYYSNIFREERSK